MIPDLFRISWSTLLEMFFLLFFLFVFLDLSNYSYLIVILLNSHFFSILIIFSLLPRGSQDM